MEFFEFSSDALYPSFNNELIMQSVGTATDSLLSEQPREEFPQSQAERNLNNNSTEFAMENIERTHQAIPAPHPVTSVTSSNSDSVNGSISIQQGMTETPTYYPPPYSDNRQPVQFPESMTMSYSPVTQDLRSVASNSSATWMQHMQHYPGSSSQLIPRNTNSQLTRGRNHPYFRGESTTISHQARTLEDNISRHYHQANNFSNPANSSTSSSSQILLTQSQQRQENFEFINSMPMPENRMLGSQHPSGQETPATIIVNNSVGVTMRREAINNAPRHLANVMQTQPQMQTGNLAVPVTSGINSLDRTTLPVQQVLRQLVQTIKSPNCTTEQQYQAVRMLRNDPRLMAAFLQMKQRSASQHGNMSNNIPNMTSNQQQQPQQSNATYRTTQNSTEQPKFSWNSRIVNNQLTSHQSGLMTGGSMTVSSSAVPHYSPADGVMLNQSNIQQDNVSSLGETNPSSTYSAETGRWTSLWNSGNQPSSSSSIYLPLEISSNTEQDVNNRGGISGMGNSAGEPAVTAVLQLAAARQLIVQAAASAAAAGAKSLSQTLNDRTQSLDRVMNAHCPSFLHGGKTQMKALLSLTSSANSQLSAPRIPTCSICLDKLVSTIVFPCRHFFCEICAPKIEKCGLCRELIEDRHRVYF